MYKDVKKKLLSVALCVCMIIGAVQVVPKVKAAATVSGNTVTILGKNDLGQTETCTLVIESADLSYTGEAQVPKVLYVNDSNNKKISGSENWSLKAGDEGKTVGGHTCYFEKGSTGSYSFDPEATRFPYTISQAKITEYDIQLKSRVVPWKSGGVKPALSSVKVQLNGKKWMTLTEDQYDLSENSNTGKRQSNITIKDKNIDVGNSVSADPITYYVAYPLNGTIADGTTEREMRIEAPSESYTGSVRTPNIRLMDSTDWTSDVADNRTEFVNNFTVKYFKKNLQDEFVEIGAADICDAGTYKVQVTANGGCAQLGSYYYTGTFEGIYTITAKSNDTLRVIADDVANNTKGVTIYENGKQKTPELVYTYAGGSPVTLQNVQVWDGNTNVTSQFEKLYAGEKNVGNASLTLKPIKNQSNYGSEIYIDYYITSEIDIIDMEFEGYNLGVTDIFYSGQPITPTSYKVVNKNNVPIEYEVTYGYQLGGAWYRTSDPNDANLATTGSKRIYVKGKGNYSRAPEVYKDYTVSAVNMSEGSKYYNDFTLELDSSDVFGTLQDGYYTYYNGDPREPRTILKYGVGSNPKVQLDEGTDYRVSYAKDHTNGGEVTVTVTALPDSNYTGSRSISFTILPVELSKASVVGDAGGIGFSYTGQPIVPQIVLKDGSNYAYTLRNNDYEVVEYYDRDSSSVLESAPKDVGHYQITIKNKNTANNIQGTTITLDYDIVIKDISSDPDSVFMLSGVNGENREIEWNGGKTDPAVICGNMGSNDFDAVYTNDDRPGTINEAYVTITGKGNYSGTKQIHYTITKRSLENPNIEATVSTEMVPGVGNKYKAVIVLEDKGEQAKGYTLSPSSEYTISSVTYITDKKDATDYKDQINSLPKAGEYKAVLTGTGNYINTKTVLIGCGYNISDAKVTIADPNAAYTGYPVTPAGITLEYRDENGKIDSVDYRDDTDSPFFIEFERDDDTPKKNANISAGEVFVIAVGNPACGFYGTTIARAQFTINPLDIHSNKSAYEIKITDSRGKDLNGTFTVPYINADYKDIDFIVQDVATQSKELRYNIDYSVSFDGDCTTQGTHWINVIGKGNYTGTIRKKFAVGQTPIDHADISLSWSGNSSSYAEGQPEPVLMLGSYILEKGTDKDYTYSVTRIPKPTDIGWDNCFVYTINGKNNFSGSRTEYYTMDQTQLDAAGSAENWASGQVYINRWRMDELLVDPAHIAKKEPKLFTLSYKKSDGSTKALKLGEDFIIKKYGSNDQPGTDGNEITVTGINGYTGDATFPVTLYTNIALAKFNTGSTIVSGGSISLSQLEEASKTKDGLANLVSLKNLWEDETGGRIDPTNYTVTFADSGYTPKIGKVDFIISGTQKAPRYYGGSMEISMIVTGALDSNQIRVEIGDNNTVQWQGETVMPDNTKVQVYDGNKLLTGGYINAGNSIPDNWDYTVTFSDNDGIGLATATINGVNKYSESLTQKFKITCSMSNLLVKMQEDDGGWEYYEAASHDYLYKIDTTKNKPALKLFYKLNSGDEREVSKNLYSVTYNGYENAGNANAIIGEPEKEEYKGILLGNSRSISYTLKQIPMDKVIVALGNPTPTFTGNSMTATDIGLTITYGTYSLTDADYKLTFYNEVNTDAVDGAPAKVVITAKGNFSGIVEKEFNIQPMPIYSERDINASVDELIYTGTAQTPRFTLNQVTGRLRTLKEGTDYKIYRYLDETKTQQKETPYAEIGQYYIRIEGLGNYKTVTDSYRDIPYSIKERQMDDGVEISFVGTADCPVVNGMPDCVYDGKEHRPGIQVVYNQQLLNGPDAAKPDYDVTYTDNINAGTATITIKGNGSFAGQREVSFVIQPKDISSADMIFRDENGNTFQDEKTYEWTKNPVQPTISVYDTSMSVELVKGEGSADYTVKYSDDNDDQNGQYNAGKVTLTVYGTGNYGGTKEFTYYIGEDISKSYTLINGKSSVSVDYNGLVQAPAEGDIQVHWGASTDLTDENGEKRYDIAYYKDGFDKANKVDRDQIVDAGTYYVAVIGVPSKGTYAKSSKENSCAYTINPRSIAPSYILVSGYDGTYYYTGQSIEPKGITVEDTDLPVSSNPAEPKRTVKLTNGQDYELNYSNNTSAGKASIIVTGKGNYTGSRVAYFNIISSDANGNNTWDGTSEGTGSISNGTTTIAAADIRLGFDNSAYDCMMYNGYERIPTVSINGISTNEFIITASNNVRPGIATLMITGRGNNFTGTIVKNYKIKADLSTYGTIAAIADQVYTGYQITPHVTLTCGGNMLNQGSDYTVTYLNNTNVGVATVMATATNDSYYIGTARQSFNISNTAGGMEITGYASSYTYTGYAITPDLVVTMNSRVLNRGTDYVVSYSNNINVGTATMRVTGIGSYSGTKTINYTIEAKNIENCLTTAVTNYQYTGNTYTPNVTVTDSSTGKTLIAGTDYTITYSNNTNPGTASIMVTALSKNYTGSKVIPFKITSAAVSGLRTSAIKNNSMKLSWSAQDYADGYQICNTSNRVIATTSKNSYTVKGLTSCTTYKFKVRSYVENVDGSVSYGDFSTAVSAKTMLNTPKLTAKSTKKGKVTLTWTNVAKATGYEIYYSTKKNGIYTRLKTVSKSSGRKYVDSGLASGERYYYTIRAYRTANGVKTYSNYNTIKSVKVK